MKKTPPKRVVLGEGYINYSSFQSMLSLSAEPGGIFLPLGEKCRSLEFKKARLIAEVLEEGRP